MQGLMQEHTQATTRENFSRLKTDRKVKNKQKGDK